MPRQCNHLPVQPALLLQCALVAMAVLEQCLLARILISRGLDPGVASSWEKTAARQQTDQGTGQQV